VTRHLRHLFANEDRSLLCRNIGELWRREWFSTKHLFELLNSALGPVHVVPGNTSTPQPYPHKPVIGDIWSLAMAAPAKQHQVRGAVQSIKRVRNDLATMKDALIAASPAPLVCFRPIDAKSTLVLKAGPIIDDLSMRNG